MEREKFIKYGKEKVKPKEASWSYLEWLNSVYTSIHSSLVSLSPSPISFCKKLLDLVQSEIENDRKQEESTRVKLLTLREISEMQVSYASVYDGLESDDIDASFSEGGSLADPSQSHHQYHPPRPSFAFFSHAGASPSTLRTHNTIPMRRASPALCVAQFVSREGHAVLRDATHEIPCVFAHSAHVALRGCTQENSGLGCVVVLLDWCFMPLTGVKFEGNSGIEIPSGYVEVSRGLILSDPLEEKDQGKETGNTKQKENQKGAPMSVAELAVLLSKGPHFKPVSVKGYLEY